MRHTWLLCVLLPMVGAAEDTLTIAVASNFQRPAEAIGRAFSEETGIAVRFSSGSTGKLYAQILNGAPYDVFLAADTQTPRKLEENGRALENSFVVYATGFLSLWSADPAMQGRDCLLEFERGNFRKLAIANPQTAPYGGAAKTYLQKKKQWQSVVDRIVYGENVSQAFQFVASGNATFGIVAASLLRQNEHIDVACEWQLAGDHLLDAVVPQAGVVLRRAQNIESARSFLGYLRNPEVQGFLARYGYARGESPAPGYPL